MTGTAFDGGNTLPSVTIGSPYTVDNSNVTYLLNCQLPGSTGQLRLRAIRVTYNLQVSPAPATAAFSDVPTGHWAFRYIEALFASGITAGCGGGNYCPDDPLTRAQMAVFLSAALGLHWPG